MEESARATLSGKATHSLPGRYCHSTSVASDTNAAASGRDSGAPNGPDPAGSGVVASASSGRALAPSLRWPEDYDGGGSPPPLLLAGAAAAAPGAAQPLFVDCEKGSDAAGGTSARSDRLSMEVGCPSAANPPACRS